MQQIERVGAVALLFLLVTIVAVALWDDGDPADVQAARSERASPASARQSRLLDLQRAQQAESVQDRHDGLRSLRANPRERTTVPLTGGAGQVAPLRQADDALEVTAIDHPPPEQPPRAGAGEALDPRLLDRGFRSGGRTAGRAGAGTNEEPAAVERPPLERDSRKLRLEQADEPRLAGGGTYLVRPNDSLERIARHQLDDGQRWRELADLNGIAGPRYLIREGQTLLLPTGSAPARPAPRPEVLPRGRIASAGPQASEDRRSYVIAQDDVLGTIAQRELGSARRWGEILDLNPGLDPKKLWVGQTILLPGGATRPAPQGSPQRALVASAEVDNEFKVR